MPSWMQVSALGGPKDLAPWVLSSRGSKIQGPGPSSLRTQKSGLPDLILFSVTYAQLPGPLVPAAQDSPGPANLARLDFSLPYSMVRASWAGVLISWPDQRSLLFLFPSSPFSPSLSLSFVSPVSVEFLTLYACVSNHICPLKPPGIRLWAVPWGLIIPRTCP